MIPSTSGGGDPYQVGPPTNVWYNYEFPALQRNTEVEEVVGVDNQSPWNPKVAFKRGDPNLSRVLPSNDADALVVPPRCKDTTPPDDPIDPTDLFELPPVSTTPLPVQVTVKPNPTLIPIPEPVLVY
jgi:hypothetical protein